ncbi:hypothetical protein CMEL01_11392 [Colletotrichum melonis]|uniref:Uncharacterized protein n=2 Tax=Colletotrichum acutatum species complex TaxID=2707335 RepID=A0AAI9Z7Q2_9PEZI|nr:uncharacterized protein CCOS01_01617 [Colletotrichum costaricense]KAK1467399.1 hypothetical protein CMEL01_11392 [Colletotrichum melonis]KAK1536297.1 hypothetical protein CCOS01_01617 [Colletotrichum costaricense]
MSAYTVSDSEFQQLEGKIILVTGGAAGIGRAIVDLAHRHGAKVAFCDVDETRGKQVQKELGNVDSVFFKKCDISDWNDLVSFFQDVHSELGPIDTVISNAAINKIETLDEPGSGADWYLQKPDVSVLNVNMAGTWYVTKCAIGFFRKNPETRSQLVLFGSAASFFDTPPCYTYCASKAAVLGLMRAMRTQLPKMNITVNMIAPWMTDTEMVTDHIRSIWKELPANTPKDVATASLLPAMRPEVNGKSFFIHGGNISDLEDKLDETQPLWLGTDLDKQMREGQRRLIP